MKAFVWHGHTMLPQMAARAGPVLSVVPTQFNAYRHKFP